MSESSVLLALINLVGVIVKEVAPTLAAIAACGAVYVSWKNGKKVDTAKRELEGIRDSAKRSVEELDLMATGAHWRGYTEGVAEERKRVSDFSQLNVDDWRG